MLAPPPITRRPPVQPAAAQTGSWVRTLNANTIIETIKRAEDGKIFHAPYEDDLVKDLLEQAKKTGNAAKTITLLAHQTRIVGDAHMLGHNHLSPEGDDYLLECKIAVEEQ